MSFLKDRIYIICGAVILVAIMLLPWLFYIRTEIANPANIRLYVCWIFFVYYFNPTNTPPVEITLFFDFYEWTSVVIILCYLLAFIGSTALIAGGILPTNIKLVRFIILIAGFTLVFFGLILDRFFIAAYITDTVGVPFFIQIYSSSTYNYLWVMGPGYIVSIAAASFGAAVFVLQGRNLK
ncbi:MAG: hypothetical protein ACTSRB_08045 [Candidatus Helarchaeota archaeon]